jgi:hypothetical protein
MSFVPSELTVSPHLDVPKVERDTTYEAQIRYDNSMIEYGSSFEKLFGPDMFPLAEPEPLKRDLIISIVSNRLAVLNAHHGLEEAQDNYGPYFDQAPVVAQLERALREAQGEGAGTRNLDKVMAEVLQEGRDNAEDRATQIRAAKPRGIRLLSQAKRWERNRLEIEAQSAQVKLLQRVGEVEDFYNNQVRKTLPQTQQ